MRTGGKIGLGLAFAHGTFFLIAYFVPRLDVLLGILGMSVYVPLVALDGLGLPVFGRAESWGFSSPSGLGYAMVIGFWLLLWLLVGLALEWAIRRIRRLVDEKRPTPK